MSKFLLAVLIAALCQINPGKVLATETVSEFRLDSFKQIVASRQGTPFVVLIWSLDCAYCAQSFEVLSDAKKKYGLDVVTVATDPAGDMGTARLIAKKLSAYKLVENAWAFGPVSEEQLRYAIDPKWRGELPRSYWFSRDGTVVAQSGLVTKEAVARHLGK